MADIEFGLWLTLVGMGTVVGLLLLLWLVLVGIGRLDRRPPVPALPPGEAEETVATDGPPEVPPLELTDEQLAAISVAVITHARVRRLQAAPAMRTHEPGSHLFASRWVAVGRAHQSQPWRRGK